MPLDPLLKAFLDQPEAQAQLSLWRVAPDEAREMFAALMRRVGPKDVPVGKITDFALPGPAGDIPARNYSPVASGSEPQPTLIYYHGGGFVVGSIETHDGLCRMLADLSGCRIVSVGYRLGPEHQFPAAVEDALAAARWIEANAGQLGVDANRLGVGGDSTGATLAAVVCLLARDARAPSVRFQALLFPATHVDADTNSRRMLPDNLFLDARTLAWSFEHYLGPEGNRADARVSPLLADNFRRLPAAYVMVGGHDLLHDEGVAYAEKLRAAGCKVTLDEYRDLTHDFIYLHAVVPQAGVALGKVAAAMKAALSS